MLVTTLNKTMHNSRFYELIVSVLQGCRFFLLNILILRVVHSFFIELFLLTINIVSHKTRV